MGTYPHGADTPPEPSARPSAPDAEPHDPRPLPQRDRRKALSAIAVMLVGLAIIALVVLL